MTLRNNGKQNLRSRGAAMLLVLIAVAMCTIMALSFLAAQQPTAVVASNIDRKTQARAIAESALKMAIDYVNEDANWRSDKSSGTWMADIALDGGTFTLTGTDEDDGDLADDSSEAVLLTVIATYDGVTHRVSAVVAPGGGAAPGTSLLLVVGDSSALTSEEQSLQTLFGFWGYTVSLLDDAAAQATYDAAVAANDVVFITGDVSAGSVSTKLLNASIGVVIAKPWLHDDFGLTDSNTTTSDTTTTTDVAVNNHMITEGFAVGPLAIYQSAVDLVYSTAVIAPGVTTLTDRSVSGTAGSLMVAGAGADLHTGSAAGRRVIFPTGGTYEPDNLTPAGEVILWRCLQWAAGANSVPPMRIALYELMEQSVAAPTLMGHWKLDEEPPPGFGGVSAGNIVDVGGSSRVDSYDSSLGSYASQTPGTDAVLTVNSTGSDDFYISSSAYVGGDGYIGTGGNPSSVFDIDGTLTGTENVQGSNIPIDTLSAPTGLPGSSGNYSRSSGSETFSSDVTYGTFYLKDATITISGNVTMHITGDMDMQGNAKIVIPDGSALTLYTGDDVDLEGNSEFNADSTAANRLTVYGYGNKHIDLKGNTVMAATVYTNDELHIQDNSHFYGKLLAKDKLNMDDSSEFHYDTTLGGFATGGSASVFGEQSPGGSSRVLEKDQAATKFTLTEAMTITSISAYIYGGDDGGYVAFAIYDHDSADNEPGNLLAESGSKWVSDENWQWETGTLPATTLTAGTYWLAMATDGDDDDMRYRYTSGGTTEQQSEDAERNGFDTDWDDSADEGTYSHTMTIYASGTANNSGMPDAADETAAENDGTYEGDSVGGYAGFGDGGKSVQFDGDGDYVEIPHDASYLLDAGSISLHHYPTSTNGVGPLFSKDASGQSNGGHVYIYRSGTRIAAKIETTSDDPYATGSTIYLQSGTGVVNKDAWNHVAVTWGDGQFRLYADGVLVDSANHLGGLGTASGGTGNAEPIVIGGNSNNSTAGSATPLAADFYEGRIDDVRIYDLPIDAGQAGDLAGASDPGARTAPGYVIADTSGYSDPADMVIYDTTAISWVGGGGLTFTGDTIATTAGAISKIHDAVEDKGAFTIELNLTRALPSSTVMPSHVFGYTDTAAVEHNFLVGQDDANYEVRARDSVTGVDGKLSPEFTSATDLASGVSTNIVFTYDPDAGEVRVYLDGVLDETRAVTGTITNWDDTFFLVLGGAYDDTDHWNGTISRIAVYDGAFNQSQAENVYNGEEPGDGTGGAGTVRWDELD